MSDIHTVRANAAAYLDPNFIDDLREFLENRADAEYFADSPSPCPNQAMRLLVRLNELFPEDK